MVNPFLRLRIRYFLHTYIQIRCAKKIPLTLFMKNSIACNKILFSTIVLKSVMPESVNRYFIFHLCYSSHTWYSFVKKSYRVDAVNFFKSAYFYKITFQKCQVPNRPRPICTTHYLWAKVVGKKAVNDCVIWKLGS